MKLLILAIRRAIFKTLDILFLALIPSTITILGLSLFLKLIDLKIGIFIIYLMFIWYLCYIIGNSIIAYLIVKNDKDK